VSKQHRLLPRRFVVVSLFERTAVVVMLVNEFQVGGRTDRRIGTTSTDLLLAVLTEIQAPLYLKFHQGGILYH
jgi:hypothetical protein